MFLNKLSNSIYVLNLKERTDKLSHIKFELAKIGCNNYKVVEAINGKDYLNTTRLKDGNLGLLLTYYNIHREWSAKSSEFIMLIEDDFVCATGVSHSVRELCQYVFEKLGMNWEDYVRTDGKYYRPEELHNLKGDASKLKAVTGWTPKYTFETMLDDIIEHWLVKK